MLKLPRRRWASRSPRGTTAARAQCHWQEYPSKPLANTCGDWCSTGFVSSICEQTEDPKFAKGIVKREVVETITPGAAFSDDLLDGTRNNYLCALNRDGDSIGIAAADLSTGELRLTAVKPDDLESALSRFTPREVIVARGESPSSMLSGPLGEEGPMVTERESWEFDPELGRDQLTERFKVGSLESFGIEDGDRAAVGAAGALLRYLDELQPAGTPHLARPKMERSGGTMPLDEMTRRNLELVESLRGGEASGTLLRVLDRTLTPMGARLLRQWLLAPLVECAPIEARLSAVAALEDPLVREAMREALDGVRDIERLGGKAAAGRASPREMRALGDSMARLPLVQSALERAQAAALSEREAAFGRHVSLWDGCDDLCQEVSACWSIDHPWRSETSQAYVKESIAAWTSGEPCAMGAKTESQKFRLKSAQELESPRSGSVTTRCSAISLR